MQNAANCHDIVADRSKLDPSKLPVQADRSVASFQWGTANVLEVSADGATEAG